MIVLRRAVFVALVWSLFGSAAHAEGFVDLLRGRFISEDHDVRWAPQGWLHLNGRNSIRQAGEIVTFANDECSKAGGRFDRVLNETSEAYERDEYVRDGLYSCGLGDHVLFDLSVSRMNLAGSIVFWIAPENGRSEKHRQRWSDKLEEPERRAEERARQTMALREGLKPGSEVCYFSKIALVVEVRAPLAQLQMPGANLEWVKIDDLYPKTGC
ncbi:hypothetical protein [Brevundimonas diminuta]|nr:hypothetical protein [Brevundimonas diminuta]